MRGETFSKNWNTSRCLRYSTKKWDNLVMGRISCPRPGAISLPLPFLQQDATVKCYQRGHSGLKPPHTAQTQTNSQLPLYDHYVALNTPLRHAATSIVACTFCACARFNKLVALHENRNDGMECIEKQSAHSVPPHTMHWFASTPPVRMVIQLAHNQSENPMAQTADSQPPQTLHVESEQTTSVRLRKLPSWTYWTYLFPTSSESPQML